ncbi:TetR/AcrR family transcriptional regulator [Mycobacterium barrassiae]|uniref:TetR/AcrR family transcriptional regulator n=1 Tax=Mycobacterium barrassiae TaxID=319709 RepID=UPI002265C8AB|nr:TetR/AcrR family transcriptional regulator [Mycobacterium barrassiae]MCV7302687.1 TetR/AcrR family transcriptional regulator [Mycobacterium barrassiae]
MQRSRVRIAKHVRQMLDAARRLIAVKGDAEFTTQELVTEAGVALQTFYRYFGSKDELLLAVIADSMTEACERWVRGAAELSDPLARVRYYITSALGRLDGDSHNAAMSKFVVSTRWRLHRLFPKELAEVEMPFVELLRGEINAAVETGQLNPSDPEWDSWLLAELIRSVFHFYAFAGSEDNELDELKEHLWRFCLTALGGSQPVSERPV